MKRIYSVFCVAIISGVANATPATVDYIIDGDTFGATVFVADDIGVAARVRILGIDTPEISGACAGEIKLANAAKVRLAELIPVGASVDLIDIKDDKYLGRIDAYVFDEGGANVGDILMNEGLARPYDGGRRQSWCE